MISSWLHDVINSSSAYDGRYYKDLDDTVRRFGRSVFFRTFFQHFFQHFFSALFFQHFFQHFRTRFQHFLLSFNSYSAVLRLIQHFSIRKESRFLNSLTSARFKLPYLRVVFFRFYRKFQATPHTNICTTRQLLSPTHQQ